MNQPKTLFSAPRVFNIFAVVLALGIIYAMSLAQEKPKTDAPTPAAPTTVEVPKAETQPEIKTDTPKAEPAKTNTPKLEPPKNEDIPAEPVAEKPAEGKTGEKQPEAKTGETFPVVPTDPNAPKSFADVPDGKVKTGENAEETAEPAKPQVPFERTVTFALLVFGVILVITYWLGNVLAKYWRLPDHGTRIFVLLFTFIGAIVAVAVGIRQDRLTLGIDLQGGVVLVYDVTWEEGKQRNVEKLVRSIGQRINPGGIKEIAIAPLGSGCNQLQVIIPKAEEAEVNRIERIVSESGALTFRILASRLYSTEDNAIIARGEKETGRDVRDASGKLLARWVPAYEGEKERFIGNPDIVTRERNNKLEVLVKFDDGVDITGEYLTDCGPGIGDKGERGVSFSFNAVGESKFKRLTKANQPNAVQARLKRQLGIILNDSLYSAPTIDAVIGAHGIITFQRQSTQEGQIKQSKEIEELVQILNAGALPADLNPETVSRSLIGATLGADTVQKGKVALVASAVIVLLFMLFYYRLAGAIACFCVVANITMLVALMLAFRAAFTLPGLAGIVLTIGMAVDANILIYERLREELHGGVSLKLAIHNAYAKAFSAIADSNVTTMITSIILYAVGTEQVKGFAVTLFLGIVLSMFTAIYCARTIMDIFEAQRSIRTFKMMEMFKRPNINFLGARFYCAAVSSILIIIGLVGVVERGKGILNIDFVGGVSVEAVFRDSQEIGTVRSALLEQDKTIAETEDKLNDLSVQNIQASVNAGDGTTKSNTHFVITTSIPQITEGEVSPEVYLGTVRNILRDTFGDKLVYRQFNYTIGETKGAEGQADTEVKLELFPEANLAAVQSEVAAAVKKAVADKIIDNEFSFVVRREGVTEGNTKSFKDWTIAAHAPKDTLEKLFAPLKVEADSTPYFPTSTTVGGSVARNTMLAGLAAIVFSLICIVFYIRVRFSRFVYGIAAAVGLIHDVLLVLGFVALSYWAATPLAFLQVEEFKIGLPEVAAFLTIIGYSLNDTIILFDRIRENRGKSTVVTWENINKSINQTLSRTVLTSLTTLFVAVILYFWGGSGIHTFAFAMSLGVIFGTYSTIALCSPILYWLLGDARKREEGQ